MQLEPIAITAEVFQVGGYGLTAPEDAAIYLINFDGHAALVDAGGVANKRVCSTIWPRSACSPHKSNTCC